MVRLGFDLFDPATDWLQVLHDTTSLGLGRARQAPAVDSLHGSTAGPRPGCWI